MGKVQTQPDYSNNAAFEQIWAILQETAKRQEETAKRQEEYDRQMKEQMKESAKRQEESAKRQEESAKRQEEYDRQMKEQMKESAKRQEESAKRQEEYDRQMKEQMKESAHVRKEIEQIVKNITKRQEETAEQMKETDRKMQETDRIVKENAKLIGGLGGRYGEMIEYMVKPTLVNKFNELGYVFTKVYPDTVIKDEKNNILAQIDMTLENGDKVMIVEVKSKPSIEDIKDHIERMGKVRRHADLHDDKRKYLGAVAGMVINGNERDFILKNGFYLVEPSGETFTITSPNGEPREW